MKIRELLARGRPSVSFEFFPPKNDAESDALRATIETLRELEPTFVSITYGAGGSMRRRTVDLAKAIKRDVGLEVLAHVTCVGSTRDELRAIFDDLAAGGVENVLALRGDPPKGAGRFEAVAGGFEHASDLVGMLAREYDFCVVAAAYPEKHTEAPDEATDLVNLRRKVDAGADVLITQLFFENSGYFDFVERARAAGITVPIVPGIMPITNYSQVARFGDQFGTVIPPRLRAEFDRRSNEPAAIGDLGVAFATLQSAELLARGAPGIHYYTLNRSPATRAVVSALLATNAARLAVS